MSNKNFYLKQLVTYAQKYGFIFPSSEIYGRLSAVYDYGPNGTMLKNNLKKYWWKAIVQCNNNIVGLDTSILTHSKIWEASGHLNKFNDIMIDNKDSKLRYRIHELLEYKILQLGDNDDKIQQLKKDINNCIDSNDMDHLLLIINKYNIKDPSFKTTNWTIPKNFNLMFSTNSSNDKNRFNYIYLRPETAQGTFTNLQNIINSNNLSIPFGIAQIGKAFRNEIIARQFIMRMKEFEQMELQFFVKPEDNIIWYQHWQNARMNWYNKIINTSKLRFKKHSEVSHYEEMGIDIEYHFPFGFKEIEGIHLRNDYDLKSHQNFSNKKMSLLDKQQKSYIPYVIETSLGVDRLFLAILYDSLETNKDRLILKLNPLLAPVKIALMPLIANDNLINYTINIYNDIKLYTDAKYIINNSIGKRYRQQDAIGTPYCITVDYESLKNDDVTIRYRDSMRQKRIKIKSIKNIIKKLINWENLIKI